MNLKLVEEWLPPVMYRSLLKCAEEMKFIAYPHKHLFDPNLHLKDTGKGKRAFLLATGPSINDEKLEILAGEDCFSISNFFLHDKINDINPLFHGFAPYHEPLILENYVEWLRLADKRLPASTKIILGHKTADIVNKFSLFPERKVYYVYLTQNPSMLRIDLLRPILAPQTGPLLLLPLIMYMGYEQIYLLGCDNTTLRDYKKTITNFYPPDNDVRENATVANVWSNIIDEHSASLKVFQQYQLYNELALSLQKPAIVNLSQDSWLDCFPCSRLESLPLNYP